MIIISDCISEKNDEGCTKIAGNLARRIKNKEKAEILTYKNKSDISDIHFESMNPLFLEKSLIKKVLQSDCDILYIPKAATKGAVLRSFILSVISRRRVFVLLSQRHRMDSFTQFLLEVGKVNVLTLSKDSYDFYTPLGEGRVVYLRTGINTEKFIPVSEEDKIRLKHKYNIPIDKKTVLHVGHLRGGRNIEQLLKIDENNYNVLLVISSQETDEQGRKIRTQLETKTNIRIIDTYLNDIEEIYQLADVYFFPIAVLGNCIDIPLSVLEAASCNIPVVCTHYGELKSFEGAEGFYFIDSMDEKTINEAIYKACSLGEIHARDTVLPYDWEASISELFRFID